MKHIYSPNFANYLKSQTLKWNFMPKKRLYLDLLRLLFRVIIAIFILIFLIWSIRWLIIFIFFSPADPHAYIYSDFTDQNPDLNYFDDSDLYKANFEHSHPFENTCKFPTLKPYDPSLEENIDHSRQIQCPPAQFENLVSQTRDGEFLIGHASNGLVNKTDMECYYRVLKGALYPNVSTYDFEGEWIRLPINVRFTIRQTKFVVKCWSNTTRKLIYHNAFMNVPEKKDIPDVSDRYNIAILQIDSTSRNQFFRHMPHTLRFMHENDFQILRGYTKVGDNSAINSLSLLAGYVFEAEYRGLAHLMPKERQLTRNQTFNDIFKYVEMVYDEMKKDGCAVMFNDDIGGTQGGLFHYQSFDGFRQYPTEYYFRPYYTYLYKNLGGFSTCSNGEFLIPKWVDIWERFSTMYKNKCHFSFNHLSYFTHSNGNNLELYDILVSDALKRMKNEGVFDNTIFVVMGDHGQRLHKIKFTYYGKVEERMGLASIYMPEKFRKSHPDLYQQLIKNTNRFTSTFDLHETLKFLSRLRYENTTQNITENTTQNTVKNLHNSPLPVKLVPSIPESQKVGLTLFEDIPNDRSCKDAKVPINFCVCMEPLEDPIDVTEIRQNASILINEYLHKKLSSAPCLLDWKIVSQNKPIVNAVTSLVRFGPRYMEEWENRIKMGKPAKIFREIVEVEQNLTISLRFKSPSPQNDQLIKEDTINANLMFRFQHQREPVFKDERITLPDRSLSILSDPWVSNAPCPIFELDQLCSRCNQPKIEETTRTLTTTEMPKTTTIQENIEIQSNE